MNPAAASQGDNFSTNAFLQFLFSVVFMFVCCFGFLLYVHSFTGFVLTFFLRLFILPKSTQFRIGGLHISLLHARIFFQNVFFQTENFSLRIVDGYLTFAFWGYWISDNKWTTVQDFMVSDNLLDLRCKVMRGLNATKGTIVGVDMEKKRLFVRLDINDVVSSDEEKDSDADSRTTDTGDRAGAVPSAAPAGAGDLDELSENSAGHPFAEAFGEGRHMAFRRSCARGAGGGGGGAASPAEVDMGSSPPSATVHAAGVAGLGDEVVKPYDYGHVLIRSRPGRVQLHCNGMRFSLYNATGKYKDLATVPGANTNAAAAAAGREGGGKVQRRFLSFFRRRGKPHELDGDVDSKDADLAKTKSSSSRRRGRSTQAFEVDEVQKKLDAAKALQLHQLKNKSAMQRFFAFIGGVEVEFYDSFFDLGGAGAEHPYFLHTSFHRGEGRLYLTDSPNCDIYRMVFEMSLHKVDMRMAQMDSKLTENQVMRNPSLRDRAQLLFGTVGGGTFSNEDGFHSVSSDLIKEFGILMNGNDMNTVHVVFYRDSPNVHAAEPVTDRTTLPKTGVEVLLDTPKICYGPWLEYCRSQIWSFFLPPNFRPLQPLQFEVGMPRPMAGLEFVVEFMKDTTLEVPFKHRERTPAPPFGIVASNRKGMLCASLGKGSQFIQPGNFLLPGEEKQNYAALFMAQNIRVQTTCVLDRPSVFLEAESLQFFLDRQDGINWNERKLWNILPLLTGAKIYWYMIYTDFFMDLLHDWQFAQYMYHHNTEPLTTAVFNTTYRAVRDFIPNVKRFEIFCIKSVTLYVNINAKNVVYSEDPNDMEENTFLVLRAKSLNFSMVLPADQYMLSEENEVVRPLEAVAKDIEGFLSLPKSHQLYQEVDENKRWASCAELTISGTFTSTIPNQSVPQDLKPTIPETGRTKLTNYLDLHVELSSLCGNILGCHAKAIIAFIENMFLDDSFVIAPDELFWLLAKLQSHATDGKNRRKDFKNFVEMANPAGNDLETSIHVILRDIDANVCTSLKESPSSGSLLNLRTGYISFTYIKQFACNDMAIVITPITARVVSKNRGRPLAPSGGGAEGAARDTSYLCVGDISVGISKHFGRLPLKPKVHEAISVSVGGVSFNLDLLDVFTITEVAQAFGEHFRAEDLMMLEEVNAAMTVADLMAENVLGDTHRGDAKKQASSNSFSTTNHQRRESLGGSAGIADSEPAAESSSGSLFDANEDDARISSSRQMQSNDAEIRQEVSSVVSLHATEVSPVVADGTAPKRKRRVAFFGTASSSSSSTDTDEGNKAKGFARTVSMEQARAFADFMESVNKASDEAKDYGLFFTYVELKFINGVVRADEEGVVAVNLPQGVRVALSTLNDLNSNKRLSVAVKNIFIQSFIQKNSSRLCSPFVTAGAQKEAFSGYGDYIEVFHLQTSLCVRQYTAYPFDGSLERHAKRQRKFIEQHNYEGLITLDDDPLGSPRPMNEAPPTAKNHMPPLSKRPSMSSTNALATAAAAAGATSSPAGASTSAFAQNSTDHISPGTPSTAADLTVYSPMEGSLPPGSVESAPVRADRTVAGATGTVDDDINQVMGATRRRLVNLSTPAPAHRSAPSLLAAETPPTVARNPERRRADADGDGEEVPAAASLDLMSTPTRATFRMASPNDRELSPPHSPSGSHSSIETTAHTQRRGSITEAMDDDTQSAFLENSLSLSLSQTRNYQSGNDFKTCMSMSQASDQAGGMYDDYSSSLSDVSSRGTAAAAGESGSRGGSDGRSNTLRPSLQPQANERLSGASTGFRKTNAFQESQSSPKQSTTSPYQQQQQQQQQQRASTWDLPLPPSAPTFLYYQSFFCQRLTDFGVTSLNYDPRLRGPSGRRESRRGRGFAPDRTCFDAEIPVVSFSPAEVESRVPDFFVARAVYDDVSRKGNVNDWIQCQADNRERSQSKSTTKHLHVQLTDPLTVLITKEFIVFASVTLDNINAATTARRSSVQNAVATTFVNLSAMRTRRRDPIFFQGKNVKSKVRIRQKRWQWEDLIYSTLIPCIEVKLLTHSPVPSESSPPAAMLAPLEGVYCSTLVVRDASIVCAQNRPPSGVAGAYNMKLSVTVKVSTIALLSHIEYEPLKRSTRMRRVDIPFVDLSSQRDLMAILYVTNVVGKGKRDMQRGMDGGACNVAVNDVAVHLTRDAIDYFFSIQSLVVSIERMLNKHKNSLGLFQPLEVPDAPRNMRISTQASFTKAPKKVRGKTVQGNGSINSFVLEVVDSHREKTVIVLDTKNATSVRVSHISVCFIVVTPHRLGDRNIDIRGMGEIRKIHVRLFPSLLHAVSPRRASRGDSSSPFGASGGNMSQDYWIRSASDPFSRSSDAPPLRAPNSQPLDDLDPPTARGASSTYVPERETSRFVFIYSVSFSLTELEANVLHSFTNYVQLTGKDLTGCAESRPTPVTSRECVQMDVLTEGLTDNIARKLRAKAMAARERARKSRYAAPPLTTAQLLYKSSISFHSKGLSLVYVADTVVPNDTNGASGSAGGGGMSSHGPKGSSAVTQVFVSSIDNIYITAHTTKQHDIRGEQMNLLCILESVSLQTPYAPNASETILPQIQQFIEKWKQSVAAASRTMRQHQEDAMPGSPFGGRTKKMGERTPTDSTLPEGVHNKAITLSISARNIEGVMGLPQGITQHFTMPEMSVFARQSSDERANAKLHLYPFTISSHSHTPYSVSLPHLYVLYGHDPIKMTVNVMVETVAITITPVFINHCMLTYERVLREILPIFKSIPVPDPPSPNASSNTFSLSPQSTFAPSPLGAEVTQAGFTGGFPDAATDSPKPRKRLNFLLLLEGLRFSYLTSMTNLRFSIRRMNVSADTDSQDSGNVNTLRWVVNIISAKAALVDRDDHDRMMAAVATISRSSRALKRQQQQQQREKGENRGFASVYKTSTADEDESGDDASPASRTLRPASQLPPLRRRVNSATSNMTTATATTTSAANNSTDSGSKRYAKPKEVEILTSNPLSGYVWGSVECSVTVSSGMVSKNTIESALRVTSSSFADCSPELQKALLSDLNNSSVQWNLAVYDPVVVMRFGLANLASESLRETQQDISNIKYAAKKEDEAVMFRLNRSQTFKKLQREKKRYDNLLRKTEEDRYEKLMKVTERVAMDTSQQRRGGFSSRMESYEDLYSLLSATRTHTVVANVERFLLVVPFGDGAFRSILEESPEAFECGKQERHIHTEACLSRRSFIPPLAFKSTVQLTSFTCSIESVKQFIQGDALGPHSGRHGRYVFTHRFVGRFGMQKTSLFVTEGSKLGDPTSLLQTRALLGGRGTLSAYSLEEVAGSRNTASIAAIDAPIYISRKDGATKIGAVVDVSSPVVKVSSHIVSIANKAMLETTPLTLKRCMRPPTKKEKTPMDKAEKLVAAVVAADPIEKARRRSRSFSPPVEPKKDAAEPKPVTSLTIDFSARVGPGSISLYARPQEAEAPPPEAAQNTQDSRFSRKRMPIMRRAAAVDVTNNSVLSDSSLRLLLSPGGGSGTFEGGGGGSKAEKEDRRESFMVLVHQLPLPSIIAQSVVNKTSKPEVQDSTILWIEVKADTFVFGPSITRFAKDLEVAEQALNTNRQHRVKNILSAIQELERSSASSDLVLHSPLIDVLLPLPRALATTQGRERLQSVVHIGKGAPRPRAGEDHALPVKMSSVVLVDPEKKVNSFTGVHVTVTALRIELSTEPLTSTTFTLYLDEGGSINFVFRQHRQLPAMVERFGGTVSNGSGVNMASAANPTTSGAFRPDADIPKFPSGGAEVVVRRLRAECQTKLDVKSLEINLPEANACFAIRETQTSRIISVSVHLPFDSEGLEPNLTVRVQHINQVFTVGYLWKAIMNEILTSARKLLQDGTTRRAVNNMKYSPLAQSFLEQAKNPRKDAVHPETSVLATLSLSQLQALVDLGSGNTHGFYLNSCHASAQRTVHPDKSREHLLMVSISNLGIRSEGVVAGDFAIGAIRLHTFFIQNADGVAVFRRSPEGRTFREVFRIERVACSFKERQLRDVLECSIAAVQVDAMDGIDTQGYTMVNAGIDLQKAVFGAAPTTMTVLMGMVKSISSQVAQQRSVALDRLKEKTEAVIRRGSRTQVNFSEIIPTHWTQAISSPSAAQARGRTQSTAEATAEKDGEKKGEDDSGEQDEDMDAQKAKAAIIPFFGSPLRYIPCGEVRLCISDSSLMLGAMVSGEAAQGSVVIRVPRLRLVYAECPCDDYTAAKKVLLMETKDVEVYRPGTVKTVVMGFKDVNTLNFYTIQKLNEREVGFTLTLTQKLPWTGNPRFRDFEEIIMIIKSFTDKKNADVLKQFGRTEELDLRAMTDMLDEVAAPAAPPPHAHAEGPLLSSDVSGDSRVLKALRSSKFSPQLRFGGDVSVNTEVILNWLGITEKMLPNVINAKINDSLEKALVWLTEVASERVIKKN